MRRRGVPCGCTDNGGCCGLKEKLAILWDRTIGSILSINHTTPDGDGDFTIQAGDNIEVSTVSNGIEVGLDRTQALTLENDLTVDGDIVANGDIIQNGSAYETHAEKIYTNDDYIVMRDGAVGPLESGDYSGFQITKYDGNNDGRLVMDRDGVARVGDVGDEQPLATRDESADLTDNHILKWDATNLKLIDSGIDATSLGEGLELVDTLSSQVFVPLVANADETYTINMGPFEAGYDYFLFIYTAGGENANIRAKYDVQTVGTTAIDLKIQTATMVTFNARLYRCPTNNPIIGVRLNTVGSSRTNDQEILVSGTNIKTVGGQSLLGSGDVPAGLTWTERTYNVDWTDMFSYENNDITALKHVFLAISGVPIAYIPKGWVRNSSMTIKYQINQVSGDTIYHTMSLFIGDRISGSFLDFRGTKSGVTLTTDGTTITATVANLTSQSISKASIQVYTAN